MNQYEDIFKQILNVKSIVKYHGYKEYVEFFEIYVTIKTNHPKGNLCVTLRPTPEFIHDNLETPDVIIDILKFQINDIHKRINSGDTSFIGR